MDFGEFVDADPCVDLGGFETGMAEEFRDVTDVGSTFEHPRRRRVTEQVTGTGFVSAGVDLRADRARQPVEVQRSARRRGERQPGIGAGDEVRSRAPFPWRTNNVWRARSM